MVLMRAYSHAVVAGLRRATGGTPTGTTTTTTGGGGGGGTASNTSSSDAPPVASPAPPATVTSGRRGRQARRRPAVDTTASTGGTSALGASADAAAVAGGGFEGEGGMNAAPTCATVQAMGAPHGACQTWPFGWVGGSGEGAAAAPGSSAIPLAPAPPHLWPPSPAQGAAVCAAATALASGGRAGALAAAYSAAMSSQFLGYGAYQMAQLQRQQLFSTVAGSPVHGPAGRMLLHGGGSASIEGRQVPLPSPVLTTRSSVERKRSFEEASGGVAAFPTAATTGQLPQPFTPHAYSVWGGDSCSVGISGGRGAATMSALPLGMGSYLEHSRASCQTVAALPATGGLAAAVSQGPAAYRASSASAYGTVPGSSSLLLRPQPPPPQHCGSGFVPQPLLASSCSPGQLAAQRLPHQQQQQPPQHEHRFQQQLLHGPPSGLGGGGPLMPRWAQPSALGGGSTVMGAPPQPLAPSWPLPDPVPGFEHDTLQMVR
jgi:hypothetical protein